jgi:SNF family Na+-dependent transporter
MKSFSSKIGVLLAAAGSAVGLGSLWKFPYVVGENGGGAFIILYIVCALVFGLPLVMNEFLVEAVSNSFAGMDATALKNHFTTFEGNPLLMITYAIVAIVVVALILVFANTLIVLSEH